MGLLKEEFLMIPMLGTTHKRIRKKKKQKHGEGFRPRDSFCH